MRVLHVIPSLSPRHGGPSFAIRAIARALADVDVDITIATTDDDGNDARLDVPLGIPLQQDGAAVFYFRRNFLPYKVSFGLARWLNQNIGQFDIVHIHALFSFSSTAAARAARKHGIPYVVRPLGVLNRWGLVNRRSLAKQISLRLVEFPILYRASAIHYTSDAEKVEAIAICGKIAQQKSAVIPLPIENVKGDPADFLKFYPQIAGHRVVLFLSRIDPKKGLELLLDAFSDVQQKIRDVVLVIAGDGDPKYLSNLHRRAAQLGITDSVVWAGHIAGACKSGAFAAANVFVLPSSSENFGIAAAEALAAGVPTIVSEGVAISRDIREYCAGNVVLPEPRYLADAMTRVLASAEEARIMSSNGLRLVHERYSPSTIGASLRELYSACFRGFASCASPRFKPGNG